MKLRSISRSTHRGYKINMIKNSIKEYIVIDN